MGRKLILIGGGGHARVLKDTLDMFSHYEILGFTDIKAVRNLGVPYLGDDRIIKKFSKKDILLVNGIGSVKLPLQRREIYERFKKQGYRFLEVIHPHAYVSSKAKISQGVQIMAGVVINTGAVIGEDAIINTSSSVDHDCRIGKHSHIAPGVTLCGAVRIGECCLVGTGAKIIQGISIGSRVLVPAGEIIRTNKLSGRRIPISR